MTESLSDGAALLLLIKILVLNLIITVPVVYQVYLWYFNHWQFNHWQKTILNPNFEILLENSSSIRVKNTYGSVDDVKATVAPLTHWLRINCLTYSYPVCSNKYGHVLMNVKHDKSSGLHISG